MFIYYSLLVNQFFYTLFFEVTVGRMKVVQHYLFL